MSTDEPPRFAPGRKLMVSGRGTTFIRELPGPPGAPTLMLLHGLGATSALNWGRCFRALGERFRVVAMDQRGHGRGFDARARFRLSDCADDVVAVADALGCERIIPVGYSMGGPIAKLVWRRASRRVSGLVLCATARSFGTRMGQRAARTLSPIASSAARLVPDNMRRCLARPFYGLGIRSQVVRDFMRHELQRSDPAALMEAAYALRKFSSHEWVGHIDVPTAVVVMLQDRLVPVARQEGLAAAIPGAHVQRLAAGHLACAERPDLFVPALVEACAAVSA